MGRSEIVAYDPSLSGTSRLRQGGKRKRSPIDSHGMAATATQPDQQRAEIVPDRLHARIA